MGQKVNPIGFRLGVNRDWRSKWYASPQEMPAFLHSDLKIRDYVKKKLQFAAVSKIVIERAWNSIRVTIYTARPTICREYPGGGCGYYTFLMAERSSQDDPTHVASTWNV